MNCLRNICSTTVMNPPCFRSTGYWRWKSIIPRGCGSSEYPATSACPCIAMPPLCHAVREPGCACQTFCNPSSAAFTAGLLNPSPLDKFPPQCPQPARRSSPSLHSCWEADGSVPVHPPGAQPLQPVHLSPWIWPCPAWNSSASPRQPVRANNHPLPEPLPL